MDEGFYRAFEERFYAPREEILAMRRQYAPFVEPLAAFFPGGAAFDVGCGRGEWLELMSGWGFAPQGVDLDAGMLQACAVRGLPARQGDGIAALSALPRESQAVVSAFHVVEHLSFAQLCAVVEEALRVLKPGGLLILETPNPENLLVGAHNFYLDPTHQRPIPSGLLAFVAEYAGFARVKVLFLQEEAALRQGREPGLYDVLAGVSRDYAVLAQKKGGAEVMGALDAAWAREGGVRLQELARRYDARLEEGEGRARALAEQLVRLRASRSWRWTAPLRRVMAGWAWLRRAMGDPRRRKG